MTRPLIFACLVYTSLSAGSASEAHACPAGSEGSCEGQAAAGGDKNVLLQSKMQYEDAELQQMEAHEMGGPTAQKLQCGKDGDTNCCFTQAGADFALKTSAVPKGTTAGMCATGAKELYPKQWKMILSKEYVVICPGDECTNYRPKGLQEPKGPASGKCSDFTCKNGFLPKTAVAEDAVCTTVSECQANCCDVDINADLKRRNEILSFATIQALKNVSAISADLDEELGREKNHDLGKDVTRLKDNVAGLFNTMRKVLGFEKGAKYCPDGDISRIKGCVNNALCVIEKNLDPKGAQAMSKKELKTYTLLMELYEKFQTVTWDRMMAALGPKTQGMKFNKVSKAELACAGLSKPGSSLKALSSESFLEEADTEDQEAAYRVSAALVDAAMKTHDVLDSHKANSSVDETVAALHRAWQVPCEMLDCDHTNYWDFFGASHRHSLALIESGASASHMKAFVAVRTRLEYRVQLFLGTDGNQFADRIIQSDGTATSAHVRAYVDVLCDAATQTWTEHPKKYGVDSLLTSLVPRQQLIDHATTDLQKQAVQAVLDDSLITYSNKATLQKMMREKGLSVSDELDEEDDAPLSVGERSSLLDRSLSRKGVKKVFEKVGGEIVKTYRDTAGKIKYAFTKFGEAMVTVATALGEVAAAFADFVLSLVQCVGFAQVGTVGYVKAFGSYVKVGVSCTVEGALNNILNYNGKVNSAIGVAITFGVVIGAGGPYPDGVTGFSVGVGVNGGFACGVNSNSVVGKSGKAIECSFTLGVGVTASASLPAGIGYNARRYCILGATAFGIFKCGVSHGVTVKIMCCSFNLMTGCQSCGTGGCKEEGTAATSKASEVDKAVATNGAGAQTCDESKNNGYSYRGCQFQTRSGRTCQRWSAQNPHKHTMCRKTTRCISGCLTQVGAITAKEEATGEGEGAMEQGEGTRGRRRCRRRTACGGISLRRRRTVYKAPNQNIRRRRTIIVDEWCTTEPDTRKGLGDHNYCRDPNHRGHIWCWTVANSGPAWEYCDPVKWGQPQGAGYEHFRDAGQMATSCPGPGYRRRRRWRRRRCADAWTRRRRSATTSYVARRRRSWGSRRGRSRRRRR